MISEETMRRKSFWIALAAAFCSTLLVAAVAAGCGGGSAGPHNDQEKLVDRVLHGAASGDFQPALDAIPPDYVSQIKQFIPNLTDQELQDMLITSIESEFKSAFGYTGALLVQVYYKTESTGTDRAKVFYWGTLQYQENGETKTQAYTEKDAETDGLVFPVVKISGRWYWDLESPS